MGQKASWGGGGGGRKVVCGLKLMMHFKYSKGIER